jgi:NitT/TauT family transport system substrate-binding protein
MTLRNALHVALREACAAEPRGAAASQAVTTIRHALHVALREACAAGSRAADETVATVRPLRRARRTAQNLAWTVAWTIAWGGAILGFAHKAHAAPLTVAVSQGPVSLPIVVAQARGFFKDEGLDVRPVDCRSGRECVAQLAGGRADVATASELVVALGSVTQPELAMFGTISASSTQIKLVARRSATAAAGGGLAGLRVATPAGTSAQYFLDSWLVFHDIDPGRVRLVPRAPEQVTGALARGEADAAAVWEPYAGQALAALGAEGVELPSPRVYTQHFGLVADRRTLERRAPEMVQLLRALVRAQHLIEDEPQAVRALFAAQRGVSPEVAGAWMAEQDYRVRLDQSLVSTMESELRWARRVGLDSFGPGAAAVRASTVLHAIEPALLRQAAPDAVGLVR